MEHTSRYGFNENSNKVKAQRIINCFHSCGFVKIVPRLQVEDENGELAESESSDTNPLEIRESENLNIKFMENDGLSVNVEAFNGNSLKIRESDMDGDINLELAEMWKNLADITGEELGDLNAYVEIEADDEDVVEHFSDVEIVSTMSIDNKYLCNVHR